MNRLDFLRISIERDWIYDMAWVSAALGIPLPQPEPDLTKPDGSVQTTTFCTGFILDGKFEKLEDVKPKEPVLSVASKILVDKSLASNIVEPVESSVGMLLMNHYLIISALRGEVPYVNSAKIIDILDGECAKRMKRTPPDPSQYVKGEIYTRDFENYQKTADWMRQFAPLVTVSATYRIMVEPDGIVEFKAALAKKYEGKLYDPVELVKYENEIADFDKEWRKNDVTWGKFGGKKIDVSRKKLHGVVGATLGFNDKDADKRVYTGAIREGYSMDPKDLVLMVNDARGGSYSRGKETVDGGVGAKRTLASTNVYRFLDQDCGSRVGVLMQIREDNIKVVVGRTLITPGGGQRVIENSADARNYLGKTVSLRSAIGCRLKGQNRCRVCAGERMFKNPDGIAIVATEVTSEIITTSMKAMHGTITKLAKIDLKVAFT